MTVVGRKTLDEFCKRHADVGRHVSAWLQEVKAATWETPHDVTKRFPRASILSENRIIFDLRNNHYRLLVRINYKLKVVHIERIGTHAEYDRWSL